MADLKKEAEALGIDVDGRWSDETLQEKIDEANQAKKTKNGPVEIVTDREMAQQVAKQPKRSAADREKTLHELNLEAQEHDRAMRNLNTAAAKAAQRAVEETLAEKRPDGRRTRKPVRPVAQ